jgi:hypothetical protein
VSVHLPGDRNRKNSSKQKEDLIEYIIEEIDEHKSKYIIIGGDFNCPVLSNDAECKKWINQQFINNDLKQIEQDESFTTCSFDYGDGPQVIDTIYYSSKNLSHESYEKQKFDCHSNTIYKESDNGYSSVFKGSDHAWILSTFKKKESTYTKSK